MPVVSPDSREASCVGINVSKLSGCVSAEAGARVLEVDKGTLYHNADC